ncbi:MAG: hypothetical protein KA603_01230 [Azonexus sp.]|nr:hypothetical protein [Betaproteobacteria bacterium]MBK8918810.1 hypothetical protein [Betaproteobacteria bacterium]MBP6034742.1 hypothetical protein [Azonexus sp.]MBP6905282.1 hypothetical protein [Azonexus sp.]
MKSALFLALGLVAGPALAYSGTEMLADCQAAESFFAEKKSSDPYQSIRGARCLAYISGFADGYGVADFLAGKVGVQLNALCLPGEDDRQYRLLRAVVAHLEKQPPGTDADPRTLVAGALSKAFACAP